MRLGNITLISATGIYRTFILYLMLASLSVTTTTSMLINLHQNANYDTNMAYAKQQGQNSNQDNTDNSKQSKNNDNSNSNNNNKDNNNQNQDNSQGSNSNNEEFDITVSNIMHKDILVSVTVGDTTKTHKINGNPSIIDAPTSQIIQFKIDRDKVNPTIKLADEYDPCIKFSNTESSCLQAKIDCKIHKSIKLFSDVI